MSPVAIDSKTSGGAHKLVFKFEWPRVHGFDFCGEIVAVGGQEPKPNTDAANSAAAAGTAFDIVCRLVGASQ